MQIQIKFLAIGLAILVAMASASFAHAAVEGNDPTNQPLAVEDSAVDAVDAVETSEAATSEEDIADTNSITVELDNFVNETLQIIDLARIKRETAPPPLTVVEQRQKDLMDDGHPFTPEGFVNAAKDGNEKIVWRYLEANMPANTRVSTGQTALHFAVLGNRLDIAQMLLSYEADPNIKNTRGDTPLHMAVAKNEPYMVALLISNGADPNAQNNDGWNSLHLAAYEGYSETVALLLEKGGDIDGRNRVGLTPLMLAIWKGYHDLAVYLLDHGADTTPRDAQGNNAFLMAVTHNRDDIVELMLKTGADPNDANGRGWRAIDIALESQFRRIANLLYAAGSDAPGLARTEGAILNADR